MVYGVSRVDDRIKARRLGACHAGGRTPVPVDATGNLRLRLAAHEGKALLIRR
jgi:hypothetical protein